MKEPTITTTKTLKPNKTRSKIWKYCIKNPNATYREIAKACGISSHSVVQFHLKKLKDAYEQR
jgi:predicted ArsR family transcriptional regulator